jgi:TonB family protein
MTALAVMNAPAERLKMTEAWKQWEGEVVDGHFPLRRFLGGSDHSAVFLTEFGPLSEKAALKFVEANSATAPQLLFRWERAAQLSHPHFLRLNQWGRCQLGGTSMLFVVTEFAEDNLSHILPARPLSPTETESMLRSVLEVLAYLHGQGLVHGRVKPANIMAVGETLKLTCDGVSAFGDKSLAGFPTIYDPPELPTAGHSPPGDVWSLGITLVEALTQRPSVGEGIRQLDPSLPDSVPAPFLEIARQCLRLDPQRRWSVPDIAARLLPTAPAPRKTRHRYGLPAAVAGVVLIGLLAGSRLFDRRAEQPAPGASQQKTIPHPAESEPSVPSASPVPPGSGKAEKPVDRSTAVASPTPAAPQTPIHLPTASAPGEVVQPVVPPVSRRSRSTITGKVRVGVRVSVDASGRVVEARLESPGSSRYFAKLALDSSRRWKFRPPERNGEALPSEWILRYVFGRAGTEVHPSPVSARH